MQLERKKKEWTVKVAFKTSFLGQLFDSPLILIHPVMILKGLHMWEIFFGTINILLWKLNAEVADIIKEVEVVVEKCSVWFNYVLKISNVLV
jgi:hypothetical protein